MLVDLLLDNRTVPGKLVSTAAVLAVAVVLAMVVGRLVALEWSSGWLRPGWPSPCRR